MVSLAVQGSRTLIVHDLLLQRNVLPVPGVHELLPALVEKSLVALGSVAFRHLAWKVWMSAVVAHAHREVLCEPAPHWAEAGVGDAAPVVHVILLEDAVDAVIVGAAPAQGGLQVFRHILFQQHEVPELSLQRAAGVGQAQAEDAIGKQAVVAQLQSPGAQAAQATLRLSQRLAIILLESLAVLGGDAVGLSRLIGPL